MFITIDERFKHDEAHEVSMIFLGDRVVLNVARTYYASVKRIISTRRATKTEKTLFYGYLERTRG